MLEETIKTKRLVLEPLTGSSASLLNDFWAELSVTKTYSKMDGDRVLHIIEKLRLEGKGLFWLIRLQANDVIVGTCEINSLILEKKSGELGCALKSECRGQGYMFEALAAVIKYAFTCLGLHCLFVLLKSDNNDSLKLFLKLGFRENGIEEKTVKMKRLFLYKKDGLAMLEQ